MSQTLRKAVLLIRLSRPLFLLVGALLYGLGAAIAVELGHPINIPLYLLGQGLVTSFQLVSHFLLEYYAPPADPIDPSRSLLSWPSAAIAPSGLARKTPLYAAVVCLGFVASLVSLLVLEGTSPPLAWIILVLVFLGTFFQPAPPLRLVTSGYGELADAVVMAGLLPTLGLTLQTGSLDRLLPMSTAPLIALYLAMLMVFELPAFASDTRNNRRTLMVRLGWSAAMRLHDLAILFAILAFVSAWLAGLPDGVALRVLLVLPLALAQIWQMWRLRSGYPTQWRTLTWSSFLLFTLTAYLEVAGYLLPK